uniref:Uncharacterized protein n=1 Tax=Candidatus Kentrum sp. MB TaxID=2138164 RepID=A0A450XL90_9GAMM|nr:MAG: hypothetical protein BECKMB1821I_GA0114274_10134 [Candidatus Kentron sp. MB]VFK75010.1 MAG: hypothetical protein BECKMB1821H_GA0114242_10145 [Candidatus Kentron sp. MB]
MPGSRPETNGAPVLKKCHLLAWSPDSVRLASVGGLNDKEVSSEASPQPFDA